MEKHGVFQEGVTPCEECGDPSTTMVKGKYVCEVHNTASMKVASVGGIQHTFRRSIREMVMDADSKIKITQ